MMCFLLNGNKNARVACNRQTGIFLKENILSSTSIEKNHLALQDKKITQQKFTPQQALPKLMQYCAYQERCHSEVKEKLYNYGVYGDDAENIISKLIEENYLNEERFAIHFAGGRFRMKQWGKVKIKYELKQKQVSEYCIKKALHSLDADAYEVTLNKLAAQKLKLLKGEKNIFIKKRKLQDFLLQRGFENDLVRGITQKI